MRNPTPNDPEQIHKIALDLIDNGPADTQRIERDADATARLAQNIQRNGVLQPIILRRKAERYETIAGGYRRDAARLAGLTYIPAQIVDCDDAKAWEYSTVENVMRHNLSPVEEGGMVRHAHVELNQSLQKIALAHGRSVNWCEDRIDLMSWPPDILQAIHAGAISKAAAKPLATINNPRLRSGLIEQAVEHGASARWTAVWAQNAKLRADNATEADAADIANAPNQPPPRVVATCWMCSEEMGIEHMSHAATCPGCVEAVRRQRDAVQMQTQLANDPTALAASSAVTPT